MAKKPKNEPSRGPATITNRRATFDYHVLDTFEAGMVLVGSEVKSLFLGRANLTDSYCRVVSEELWMLQCDVEPYVHSSVYQPERRRERKLLMKRREIDRLQRLVQEKGLALIPLKIYFKNGKAKVAIGLCEGKKQFDKRQAIADRETKREEARARLRTED